MPPAVIDATVVLDAVSDINKSVQEGFKDIHFKIDKKFVVCNKRFVEIEIDLAVKKALSDRNSHTADFWMWIIRGVTLAGVVSLLALAYKTIFPLGVG